MGGKGRGKQRPPPGGPQAAAPRLAPGRTLTSPQRMQGYVYEWHGSYGWLVPLQLVTHPQAKKNGGRIYVEKRDVRGEEALEVGCNVDFYLFSDVRGLGAGDVRRRAEGEEEGGEEAPPAGWERVWSEEHDRHYYWHPATKTASWERPSADEEQLAESAPADGGDLPDAWERHFDETHGEHYYWNRVTKESSWDPPGGAEADGEGGSEEGEKEEDPEAAESGDVLAQKRFRGRVVKWQNFFGWISPDDELPADLRPLLERNGDRIYLNWREVAQGTTIKVGSELDFLVLSDGNGLSAADVRPWRPDAPAATPQLAAKGKGKGKGKKAGKQLDPISKLARQWAKQDKELGLKSATKRAAAPVDEEEYDDGQAEPSDEAGPLMPGWEELWSDEHSCAYYWHKATRQSSWERPAMPVDDAPAPQKLWEGEGSQQGASYLATPMTPLLSRPGRDITPITPASQRAAPPSAAPPPGLWKPNAYPRAPPTPAGAAKRPRR